jgi:hypothetical protein
MYNAVRKFLALYHHLTLPGIGNFTVEVIPAQLDFINRNITSPHSRIVFSNAELPAEKKFYDFLSDELHIDEVQAVRNFADLIEQFQKDLKEKNSIYFKGVGTLTKQDSAIITFQPEEIPGYAPVITAERVIRKNSTHIVRVGEQEITSSEIQTTLNQPQAIRKERWWIAAIVLAFIGISAIAFYYLTH